MRVFAGSVVLASATLLAGCAVTTATGAELNMGCALTGFCSALAQPDASKAPDVWFGEADLEAEAGSVEWADDAVSQGDTLLSMRVRHGRSARLSETIPALRAGVFNIPEMPAGTRFYPLEFSRSTSRPGAVPLNLNMEIVTPISWCTVLPDTRDESEEVAWCLFYRTPDEHHVRGITSGSPWLVSGFSEGAGTIRGGAPVLEADASGFDHVFDVTYRIDRIRPREVSISMSFSDGRRETVIDGVTLSAQNGVIAVRLAGHSQLYRIDEQDGRRVLVPVF
jgi:hypothetical protein